MRMLIDISDSAFLTRAVGQPASLITAANKFLSKFNWDPITTAPVPDAALVALIRAAGGSAGMVLAPDRPRGLFLIDGAGNKIAFRVNRLRTSFEIGWAYTDDYGTVIFSDGDEIFFSTFLGANPRVAISTFPTLPVGDLLSVAEANDDAINPDGTSSVRQLITYVSDGSAGAKITAVCNRLFEASARTINQLGWYWQTFLVGIDSIRLDDIAGLLGGLVPTWVMTTHCYIDIEVAGLVPGQNGTLPESYIIHPTRVTNAAGILTDVDFTGADEAVVGPPAQNISREAVLAKIDNKTCLFTSIPAMQSAAIIGSSDGLILGSNIVKTNGPNSQAFGQFSSLQSSFEDFNGANSLLMSFGN